MIALIQQEIGKALKGSHVTGNSAGTSNAYQIEANMANYDQVTDECLLQDSKTSKVVGVARVEKGLYVLRPVSFVDRIVKNCVNTDVVILNVSNCLVKVASSHVNLWHCRLGHVSSDVMKRCIEFDDNIDHKGNNETDVCYVCPLAHSVELFELLHIDVWGPYRETTRQDTRFFLTVVED
ncbi:hypothetical protein LIER_41279 [Lithospermum erythrorhizon]|uniref:GAG-pre-integrase domain-containing protein n=1 Tax=Lithospermum erythrorhizon TaxID=34254 RepID=A0AAV3RB51_LITER